MLPGTLIAGRFAIERLAGSGGTGVVFQAYDQSSGNRVALKILHVSGHEQVQRFQREAQILAELEHPGFVRYVAHGVTEGQPYLVMEWLEGEDLDTRLERGALTISDSIALVARAAGAMALAHRRGIVHRDIKPANLWLSNCDVLETKVLDLGLARPVARSRLALSHTGAVMGTPGYMAPEQARGSPDLDVRADVFSLGCVLYECVTGKPVFTGEHVTAILAKILFEDAPRVSLLRPEVPPALDRLIQRMLSRRPAERPDDASAIVSELSDIERGAGRMASLQVPATTQPAVLTSREQQVLCVLLAGRPDARSGFTMTIANDDRTPVHEALRDIALQHGGRLELLVNGCAIATFSSVGQATDLVAQAARCALALQPLLSGLAMALATGRGLVAESLPVGEAVERAARLLARARPGEICLDDVSAGFLDARFLLHRGCLVSERELPGGNRLLLGKPTACVGRAWELATLEAAFSECVNAGAARAVLVTAPAGIGKSRLRHEFVRGVKSQDAEVWIGLGDPMRAGAPLGLLAQALRWAFGIHGNAPLPARRRRLRERVARVMPASEVARVSEFLGELVGTPFADDNSVALRAARQDPMLMGDQMLRAWEDWLDAESARRPIMLVFEDMHWGDLPTVKFVEAALRRLSDRPLFVLALGRPEVHEKFPRLWAERGAVEINLRQLPRKACEELVRQVLGDQASPELLARIVERAEGNAFYLEELIRTVAEGSEHLPSSVITMLQLRVAALPEGLRLVLRAASVFGGVFYDGAVASLLGSEERRQLQHSLAELTEREWISRTRTSRFAGEASYVFRHDLVREAAYATFTEADRVLGHRLAADWLEHVGETDAILIAEHCNRGGDRARAVRWYRRAAEQAMESNDLQAAIARAELAAKCGATGLTLGALRVLQGEAHNWRGEWSEGDTCASEALELLPPGSPLWAHALHQSFWARIAQGKSSSVDGLVEELLSHSSDEPMSRLHAIAHANIASHLLFLNRNEEAVTVIERLKDTAHLSSDPIAAGSIAQVFTRRELMLGNPASALTFSEIALEHFEAAGDARQVCMTQSNRGWLLGQLGEYGEAERVLRANTAAAKRLGLPSIWGASLLEVGCSLANLGHLREAITLAREVIDVISTQDNPPLLSLARICVARFSCAAKDPEAALRDVQLALEPASAVPTLHTKALAVHAQTLVALDEFEQAHAAALAALAVLNGMAGVDDWDAFVRLVYAEVLLAMGDSASAESAITLAHERLRERAMRIDSPLRRQSFLTKVPENARTLELMAQLTKPHRESAIVSVSAPEVAVGG